MISDERGWVFVGIYDGFNGPDATDFLLNNLYSNVCKELKGLLWNDKSESFGREEGVYREFVPSEGMEVNGFIDTGGDLKMFNNLGPDGVAGINHMDVLKALSVGRRKTEAACLEKADVMRAEKAEVAFVGFCVVALRLEGDDG